MKSHTAKRLITLAWSDAAREAALEARRNHEKSLEGGQWGKNSKGNTVYTKPGLHGSTETVYERENDAPENTANKDAHQRLDEVGKEKDEVVPSQTIVPSEKIFGQKHVGFLAAPSERTHVSEVRHVDTSTLTPTQYHLPVNGLRHYIDNAPNKLPVVSQAGDRNLITEGHTRLGAAVLRGETTHAARVFPMAKDARGRWDYIKKPKVKKLSRIANRILLMWSDAAREAALEARRANSHSMSKPTDLVGRLRGEQFKSEVEQRPSLSPEAHERLMAKAKGEANYKGLSDSEKAQYHTDWSNAQKATATANAEPTVETHGAAATAHTVAAKTAPEHLKDEHVGMAEAHNAAKAHALTATANAKSDSVIAGAHSPKGERAAAKLHGQAMDAHRAAAISADSRGNFAAATKHRAAAGTHNMEMLAHRFAATHPRGATIKDLEKQ